MNLKIHLTKTNIKNFISQSQFHFHGTTHGEKLLEFYIITIFIISPLYLLEFTNLSISIKTILFLLLTLLTAAAYFTSIAKRYIAPINFKSSLNRCVLYISFVSILSLLIKLLNTDYSNIMNYEPEVILLALILSYFMVAGAGKMYRYYLLLLLTVSALVYAGLLYHYLADLQWIGPLGYLLHQPQNVTAYTVLMITISSLIYCTSNEKTQSIFSFLMSGLGFFILFITDNIVGICIIGVLFLVIPVLFLPTAELIKRNMHLFFLYFFLLSNMALMTNYFKIIKVELNYDIKVSIYIDLFLSVVAILFLNYWEKIPEHFDKSNLILWKLQKAYLFAFRFVGIIFLSIFIVGDKLTNIAPELGIEPIQKFVNNFQQYYRTNHGTVFDILAEFGWIGFIFLLLFSIKIIEQLKKNYHRENVMSTILIIISIVFFVQSLFFSQQLVTTPIYIILVTLAEAGRWEQK